MTPLAGIETRSARTPWEEAALWYCQPEEEEEEEETLEIP